ncbi:hypothetical protein [Terrarubrum flagellatum]|uniref:hypothetical protein n=1 Tax=Terrirubrum flagellatum TaxID=2895980 RepID=UPI00314544F0
MDKPDHSDQSARPESAAEEAGLAALDYIGDAFAEASHDGLDSESMARACIAAGLKELVKIYGEEPVATFVESFAEKIRNGGYSKVRKH